METNNQKIHEKFSQNHYIHTDKNEMYVNVREKRTVTGYNGHCPFFKAFSDCG